tara:strand:- start:249 stop:728 length:480 start_codon:yes stop_codon:yes gene_type:complete
MKKIVLIVGALISSSLFAQVAEQALKELNSQTNHSISNVSSVNSKKSGAAIWGVGTPSGSAEGEFSTNFTQSTVEGSYSTTVWTALAVSESAGSVLLGNAYWARTLTGVSQGAYAVGMDTAASLSAANGLALFDSDFMDNGGNFWDSGLGSSPAIHRGI